jgi:hypothetical protein
MFERKSTVVGFRLKDLRPTTFAGVSMDKAGLVGLRSRQQMFV